MANLQDLPGTAAQLLAQFSAQLGAQGISVPERQYRQAGSLPVWDGEQLTTGLMGIAQGQPGHGYAGTYAPTALNLYATFFVLLIREIAIVNVEGFTSMEIPTALELDGDGVAGMRDGQALVIAASQIHGAYTLTGPGEGFEITGLQSLGPEGALAGNRLLLSMSLS